MAAGVILHTAPESLFWYWIAERHAIYLRRQAGLPKPWTSDPILRDYKFTNPFRENDRGTVWLRENFLEPHKHDDLGLLAFNICWYRMFNWTGTGAYLGWQTGWDEQDIITRLGHRLTLGEQVFTGAHIVRSAFGQPKIDSIVRVCGDLYHMCVAAGALVTCCREEKSLETVFKGLMQVQYVGPFMAYEMVTDMRHTELLGDASDIMTWANPGPGAMRGLQRLQMPPTVDSMRLLLANGEEKLWAQIPEPFLSAEYPLLEMRDIEHSLCEFDKWCRVKFGEGKPRGRYNGAA
ncbi:hypothetical protein UFOVP1196_15 [uncultured Caudovirales phage]|uniref:5-hmdU DNA kinase helical domain-containing protein n=1 Tax=uncultured Caudovirales phage TaxID=2100421 RepID=A0A6J5RBA5_9CAUD|nr:hypothetical protein UFOVP1196_15 [uncultured Caudovirales phage]